MSAIYWHLKIYIIGKIKYLKIKNRGGKVVEKTIGLEDIKKAYERIRKYVKNTPLLKSKILDEILNCKTYLKPENLQITGSYKARGACNKVLSLKEEEKERGVIAASSGNHGQGVAYAANKAGVKATIILPKDAPSVKIDGIKAFGADVILHGYTSPERFEKLEEVRREKGYILVHPFDDLEVAAGQGTIGLEILEDLEDVDAVIAPMSGGGLAAGVSTAIKEKNPHVKIVGIETEAMPRYFKSRKAGKPVEIPNKNTIADALKNNKPSKNNYPIIEKYVDAIYTVSDEEIRQAMKNILFRANLLVEPSAAVGIAAALAGKLPFTKDQKVCFILTGGNVDEKTVMEVVGGLKSK